MQEPLSALAPPPAARKCRDPGKVILGFLIMIAGGLSFFYFIPSPVGFIVGPVLVILGAATIRSWQCSHCHAKIDRDEVQCPRCALPLSPYK